jgi:5-methylcytosine-specific restriction endonuclease McrA
MYKCHCGKEYQTHKGLNAHQIAHKDRKDRYSVSRQKDKVVYNCQYCNKEFQYSKGTMNKFCSIQCNAKYVWEKKSVPKIEQGLGGNLHRYLRETRGDNCELCGQTSIWNGKQLKLQLDHIDGHSDNNKLDNVRLLCPNCHTQTETYGSKGHGNRYKKDTKRNRYLREYKSLGA